MALKLIGAVGLKVRPEAENFRDEAERDIRRQMRGADRDGYKYPIKPEVDKQQMRRDLDSAKDRLRDALGDMQKQADKKKLDLRVNSDKFRRDAGRVQEIYAAMFREMEDRKRMFSASDQFKLNTEEFEDDLREIKHRFDRIAEEMDDTEVDLKPVLDESSYRTAWARLKWLTRDRFTTIHVRVNKASLRAATNAMKALYGMSGARTGVDFIKDFGRYLRDIDKHIPALGMIGTLAVSAVGGVTALVGSVAHLANEFVRLSGAALALPGIMGGFAVGLGVMFVALKDFGRQMPEITSDLSDLAREIESNFWQEARIPMLEAWNKAFPHFQRGVEKTATSLGKWTAAFSEAFSAHFDMAAFDKMFGNLNKSIDIASLGLDDFVKSMSILGQTGSEYLPRLARWANDVNKSFADWLDEAQRTGELNRMIDTGIQKMKELGVITREAGELVYILGSAAERAGFSGFGEMANGMERFNEKLKSADGQKVLDDIFQGAAKISDGFKRALGAVGDFVWNSSDLLNDLSGIVGDMVGDTFEDFFSAFERPKFQDGLRDFFQGFSDGVGEIRARAPEISDLLGSIGTVAGSVAENMGKVIGKLLETFGPEISDALSDIAPDIERVGDSISSMMEHLDNAGFDEFVGEIIRLTGAQLGQLATDLDGIAVAIEAMSKFSKGDFEGLKELNKEVGEKETEYKPLPGFGWTKNVGDWIADALRVSWDTIKTAFSQWGSLFQGDLRGMIEKAFDSDIGQWIIEKLTGQKITGREITDALGLNGDWSHDFAVVSGIVGDGISNWWDEQTQGIQDAFNTAKEWLSDTWNGFWDWLTGLFSGGGDADTVAPSGGGDGMAASIVDGLGLDGIGDRLGEKFEEVKTWVLEKWEGFKSWLGGLFGGGDGGSPMQVAIDFVMNAIDNATRVINGVVNFARDWVANKWQGVLTALDNARTTISRVKDQALNWARGKYRGILTALDNARTTINRVKDQALNWARGKYRGVLTALDNARGTISSVKSKAQDYARGKYNGVLRALDRASSIVSSVQRKINSLKGKTVSIVTNMVTKVKKIFSADGNFMPEVKKFADGGIEKHVAQIAPAGAMRVWAEPETGGEAYIPLAKSKRTRSEQILATVADKFGMRLERYANGSDPSSSVAVPAGGDTYNINVESVPTDVTEETTSAIMFNLKHMKRGGGLAFA